MSGTPRAPTTEAAPLNPSARALEEATRPASALPMLWVNGNRVANDAAHVSALDRGFTLADGLFETMLLRHGRIFRAARHIERLRRGAGVLRIDLPYDIDIWLERAANEAAHEMEEAAVRLTVSRGVGIQGLAPREPVTPTVIVTVGALPAFPPGLYEYGLSAITASARRDERALTAGVKSLAYTESIVALMHAHDEGADEALFLDTEGHLSEASASNIFICSDGALVTPPLSCGVLPGITRQTIIELAAMLGVQVSERPVDSHELAGADEAFLTSSLRGVAPLVRVDGRAIGTGTVGPLTRELLRTYGELVERECSAASSMASSRSDHEHTAGESTRSTTSERLSR
jgi:branched-chain amino acid aminotransferase